MSAMLKQLDGLRQQNQRAWKADCCQTTTSAAAQLSPTSDRKTPLHYRWLGVEHARSVNARSVVVRTTKEQPLLNQNWNEMAVLGFVMLLGSHVL
jgi:hypothetical protein